MSDAVIVALISLAGAFLIGLPGMFAFRAQRRKTSGEAYKLNGEASKIYAEGLASAAKRELETSEIMRECRHRIEVIETDLDDLVEVVVDWYLGIDKLSAQLAPFAPPEWRPNGTHKKLVERLCKDRRITLKG
jgi:hypothetical protein